MAENTSLYLIIIIVIIIIIIIIIIWMEESRCACNVI